MLRRGPSAVAAAVTWVLPVMTTLLIVVLVSCAVPPPAVPADRVPLLWPQLGEPDIEGVSYGPDPANVADVYLPVDDVSAAVRWLRSEGPALGLNPRTVILVGHSVGGTLAALTALGWNSPTSGPLGRTERVDGYISIAGIMDFGPSATYSARYGSIWLGARAIVVGWRRAASPTSHLDPSDPPGYLVHGDADDLVEIAQVDRMVDAVIGSGTPAEKLRIDRVTTGLRSCRWHFPQCGLNATELGSWIDEVVAGGP